MADDKILSLNEARAVQKDDARLWTPLDALKMLVRDIENGDINPSALTVWYWDVKTDGSTSPHYAAAGLSMEQHIALLGMAHQRMITRWVAP